MKIVAKISGIAYVLIFITGFYANFSILSSFIEIDRPTKTLLNISKDLNLFENGLLSFLLMLVFDIVLIITLFKITSIFSRTWSYVASGFRMLHALFFGIALIKLYEVLNIVDDDHIFKEMSYVVMDLLSNFDELWTIGLLFFGVHLLVLGYLAIKSNHIPKLIGVLLIMAFFGYFVDSLAKLSYTGYDNYKEYFDSVVIITGIIGELSFTIWLLIAGFSKHKLSLINKANKLTTDLEEF
ncbi:DUF4386 domain-containing protein [Seonamhaeicola algicola]|uniref:DUF4386 domain-containing protein n=1 Tax=Seonamhaeicola algicola TaxID=1719036 RepID=A0A5C7AYH0_9FLAO|nr:DUF4386 domain-containing protein [Seonamhaeicola algicola]TXE13850.1 DUF4386 domain-containing protein [Seonamhaeicola algicola]